MSTSTNINGEPVLVTNPQNGDVISYGNGAWFNGQPATPPVVRAVAFNAEVTGLTFENVGSIYLTAGSIFGRLLAGCTTASPDAGVVELRRETGGALIFTINADGPLADRTVPLSAIPADDWYNVRLSGNGALIVGLLKGMELTLI